MKKKVFICIISVVFFGGSSCKKGEDDPIFTIHCRKARLSGEWHLKAGKVTNGVKSPDKKVEGYRFTFTETQFTEDVVGSGAHFEGSSGLTLKIEKDGTMEFIQKIDTISLRAQGNWDFVGKMQGLKNKEAVSIKLTNMIGFSGYFFTFNKSFGAFTYRIKELRNKKLVLVAEEDMIDLNQVGFGDYVDAEYVFEL